LKTHDPRDEPAQIQTDPEDFGLMTYDSGGL